MNKHLLLGLALTSCVVDDLEPDVAEIESEVTVVAGTAYQLRNQFRNECLDIPAYSKSSGVALQSYPCKTAGYQGNQQFTLEAVTGGHRIRGRDSQLCLDLPSSATADGTIVQQSACHAGQNQIWNLSDEASGHARISPRLDSSKCLYVDSARSVRIYRCNSLLAQTRSFALVTSKTHYSIRLSNTGQCLDMPSYATASGASPQLFGCKTNPNDATNQEWTLEPFNGNLRLRQRYANKCLDLRAGAVTDGTIVEQQPCSPIARQQWRLLVEPNERWKIQNVASGKCFDFYGNALRQYTCTSIYSTQLYRMEPGFSGVFNTMDPGAQPTRNTGPSALWAVDSTLQAPTIVRPVAHHNGITLEWTDPNANTQSYYVFVWETIIGQNGGLGPDEYLQQPVGRKAFWVANYHGQPLVPGRQYTIDVHAASGNGLSGFNNSARYEVILPGPTVFVGDGFQTWSPSSITAGFALFDTNDNGIVDGVTAGNGVFPRFPSNGVSAVGNRFETANGVRANLIIGYYMREGNRDTFVAHHLRYEAASNSYSSLLTMYGDLATGANTLVWLQPGATTSTLNVTFANVLLDLPGTVSGMVTSGGLAPNGTNRVFEYHYNLAVEAR